jgi:hypothetical protein
MLEVPFDSGGVLLQWIFGGVVLLELACLQVAEFPVTRRLRLAAISLVYFVGCVVTIGSLWFHSVSLFYFPLLGGAVVFMALLTPSLLGFARIARVILAIVVLFPFVLGCASGFGHMFSVVRVRFLADMSNSVTYIELDQRVQSTQELPHNKEIRVIDKKQVQSFLSTLRHTYPFHPEHEAMKNPWNVTVRFQNGDSVHFVIGSGSKLVPDAMWIQIDGGHYQSFMMRKVFTELQAPTQK